MKRKVINIVPRDDKSAHSAELYKPERKVVRVVARDPLEVEKPVKKDELHLSYSQEVICNFVRDIMINNREKGAKIKRSLVTCQIVMSPTLGNYFYFLKTVDDDMLALDIPEIKIFKEAFEHLNAPFHYLIEPTMNRYGVFAAEYFNDLIMNIRYLKRYKRHEEIKFKYPPQVKHKPRVGLRCADVEVSPTLYIPD